MNKMKRLLSLKSLVLLLALVTAIPLAALAQPRTAHAISINGQQIAIRTDAQAVSIDGYNQNGQHVQQCFNLVVNYPSAGDGYHYLNNYWWNGTVSISYYLTVACQQQYYLTTDLAFPKGFSSSDWLWHIGPV